MVDLLCRVQSVAQIVQRGGVQSTKQNLRNSLRSRAPTGSHGFIYSIRRIRPTLRPLAFKLIERVAVPDSDLGPDVKCASLETMITEMVLQP